MNKFYEKGIYKTDNNFGTHGMRNWHPNVENVGLFSAVPPGQRKPLSFRGRNTFLMVTILSCTPFVVSDRLSVSSEFAPIQSFTPPALQKVASRSAERLSAADNNLDDNYGNQEHERHDRVPAAHLSAGLPKAIMRSQSIPKAEAQRHGHDSEKHQYAVFRDASDLQHQPRS